MPLQKSIAAKIFGLALFLLFLTMALAAYLLVEARKTERDMSAVARVQLPLADSMTLINEHGLRRRLAFERWFGALNSSRPNTEVIAEASANYAAFTTKLDDAFATARGLLKSFPSDAPGYEKVEELETALRHIEATYPAMSTRQRQVLDLQLAGERDRANELLNVLNDQQRSVLARREELRAKVAAITLAAADRVSQRQRQVLWLTIAATASTVLLGLLVAALITARLTRPVRSLVAAVRAAQKGDLDQTLPVRSRDELGTLTESFNYFVQELRAKEKIKRIFGRYIDQRVLERVLLEGDDANIEGERRVMTVLFADLVGFSGLSERLTPSLMVVLLNRHFGLQAQAVQEHHGVVDKFMGDAVMAFWGAPFVRDEEHATLACRSALAQLAALEVLRRELPQITGLRTGTPVFDLRIGICSGEVVVGNIGSENTRSYTVIGDTVNVASRIEGANRIYGTQVLVNETTAQEVGEAYELREIDAITAKGKSEPVRVYELLGAAGAADAARLQLRDSYALALAAYRAQDWEAAERLFGECTRIDPRDRASRLMLERIEYLRVNAPGTGWDGVWRLQDK